MPGAGKRLPAFQDTLVLDLALTYFYACFFFPCRSLCTCCPTVCFFPISWTVLSISTHWSTPSFFVAAYYSTICTPMIALTNPLLRNFKAVSLFTSLFAGACTQRLGEHPWTWTFVHACRHMCRINRKVPSSKPHCLTLTPPFLSTLLFTQGDPGSLDLLQSRPPGSLHLLFRARKQTRAQGTDRPSRAPVLSQPLDFGPNYVPRLAESPLLPPPRLPPGCQVPAGPPHLQGHLVLDLALTADCSSSGQRTQIATLCLLHV